MMGERVDHMALRASCSRWYSAWTTNPWTASCKLYVPAWLYRRRPGTGGRSVYLETVGVRGGVSWMA